jgi:hypothetical protein
MKMYLYAFTLDGVQFNLTTTFFKDDEDFLKMYKMVNEREKHYFKCQWSEVDIEAVKKQGKKEVKVK